MLLVHAALAFFAGHPAKRCASTTVQFWPPLPPTHDSMHGSPSKAALFTAICGGPPSPILVAKARHRSPALPPHHPGGTGTAICEDDGALIAACHSGRQRDDDERSAAETASGTCEQLATCEEALALQNYSLGLTIKAWGRSRPIEVTGVLEHSPCAGFICEGTLVQSPA